MTQPKTSPPIASTILFVRHVLLGFWTLVVAIFLYVLIHNANEQHRDRAETEARTHFNKDYAFRLWAASHGGVYVPISDHTPPNQNLAHLPERDITTPSGKPLTLMNPAYVMRQVHEDYKAMYGISGRITSLKPLEPKNAPDDWEQASLKAFEQGKAEAFDWTTINGEPFLRLMKPFHTKAECLECHAHQGYKIGDVRGGLGIILPLKDLDIHTNREILTDIFSMAMLWAVGFVGIIWGTGNVVHLSRLHDNNQILLQERENRFRTVIDQASDALYITNIQTQITDCNQLACQTTGYTREELLSLCILDIDTQYPKQDQTLSFWNTLQVGQPVEISSIYKRKDGSTFPVEVRVTKLQINGETVVLGLARDISLRKKMERELEQQRQHAIQANRLNALGEMAAGIAHELNQPLTVISAIAESLCLRLQMGKAVPEQKLSEEMTDVLLLIERMNTLIQHMCVFSRDNTRDLPTTVQIPPTIQNALKFTSVQFHARGIEIHTEIPEPLPPCTGYSTQIEEVLLNLLANARDELCAKKELLKTRAENSWQPRISIRAKADDNTVTIDVSDNGNGIPENIVEKIFDPFFTTKEVGKGTGLGLSISKTIVDKHNGQFKIFNRPGEGVTFSIILPITRPET